MRAILTGLFGAVLTLGVFFSSSSSPAPTDVATANNAFALALYGRLAEEKDNLFFSPYSIFSALAMTYAGARGETARQMAAVLHLPPADDGLHRAFAAFMADLAAGEGENEFRAANALWGQEGFPFRPEFLTAVAEYYRGEFTAVDYLREENREKARQAINRWAAEMTAGKIKELIEPKVLTALTRLVLTNAVYFKGRWAVPFDPDATRPMAFRLPGGAKTEVPMMYRRAGFNYAEDDAVQILELPYAGGRLAMVVLLPREEEGIEALGKSLSAERLADLLGRLRPVEIEVFLPRFKLEGSFTLNEPLRRLGMVDAFDEYKADFTGITAKRGLYITKAVHKAYVEVNEEGTEAAAATGVVMGIKSLPPVFCADRPFIFFIRDRHTGSLLFLGRLVDPR